MYFDGISHLYRTSKKVKGVTLILSTQTLGCDDGEDEEKSLNKVILKWVFKRVKENGGILSRNRRKMAKEKKRELPLLQLWWPTNRRNEWSNGSNPSNLCHSNFIYGIKNEI